ncbi:hypothetical protein KEM56_003282, partial [Ascosphaera pollenicola]
YGMSSAGHYQNAQPGNFYDHSNRYFQTKSLQQLPDISVLFTDDKPYRSSRSRGTMSSSISSLTDIAASVGILFVFLGAIMCGQTNVLDAGDLSSLV